MANLGSIDKIGQNLTNAKLKTIQALHAIAFGREGRPHVVRKSVRKFTGFGLDKASAEYDEKVNRVKDDLPLNDVIAVCHVLNLDHGGDQDELINRVCSFMNDLRVEDDEAEEEQDEEDDESVEEEQYEENDEEENDDMPLAEIRNQKRKGGSFALTFRDVEDSIRSFSGKEDYPINKWISDFEEIADITGWNNLQKLIFAKKSLTGLAKLFVQSEKEVVGSFKEKIVGGI